MEMDIYNGAHFEIAKPQNYVYTCQTKFLESFIQFRALQIFRVFLGFEAWEFQNACRCHGNRKSTEFNTKVNNNLLRLNPNNPVVILPRIIQRPLSAITTGGLELPL
jgi:hypothetical protein